MSAVDLVILGFLKRSPAGAYELAQKVEVGPINKIVKIGAPTIYQNIKKLAKKGFLSSHRVKQGEMPEKIIYNLTDEGEIYFMQLMQQFSANPGPMHFSFNSFIKNLGLVEKETGLGMLRSLKLFFYDTKEDLERDTKSLAASSFEVKAILKQYQYLLKALISWIEEVIIDYQAL